MKPTLEHKLIHDFADIYDAEQHFYEVLQEMRTHAHSLQLQQMIAEHIAQTQQQIAHLEQIYTRIGAQSIRTTCEAATGLVRDWQRYKQRFADNPAVLDCMIACTMAKIEHFEVASYRGMIVSIEDVGVDTMLSLLSENLAQEEEAAQKLEATLPALIEQALLSRQTEA